MEIIVFLIASYILDKTDIKEENVFLLIVPMFCIIMSLVIPLGSGHDETLQFYREYGIVNGEIYGPEKLSVIVAKGIASIPLINIRSQIGNNMAAFYLDSRKLPEKFVFDFFGGMDFEKVSLQNDVEAVGRKIRKDYEYCLNCSTERPNMMFMTSPYFVQRISEEAQIPMRQIIFPNHANMCCGEGICGACSHTDNDGTTVRACK